ncbi:putative protein N(5)-glutamine methyltransferase [Glaciihabitans sp. UYNi722]|uniref:putative protein N(5)-glutamine methyltransferase n=1 Tax=Glaciihabitans sp. UYNi722 TaxID=3156344 RepID=UPI00339B39CD
MTTAPFSTVVTALRTAGCVFAEDEARLLIDEATTPAQLDALVERRVSGEPLEYILGWVAFCGLRIAVDPGVFVPRQRTEFLVHEAAALSRRGAVVLDLCCGSGALGIALAAEVDDVELYAADIEPSAVACARRNLASIGGRVFEGDLFDPLPPDLRGRVGILICNTPYVPSAAIGMMPPEARDYEPHITLDGGTDGLDVQRRVADAAGEWLAPGGHLLVEVSEEQAPHAVEIFATHGLIARIAESEEFFATVVIATQPTAR